MFKIADNPTFTREVTVRVPVDGGYRNDTLKVTYKAEPIHIFDELDLEKADDSTTFLKHVIIAMDDLVDEKEKPLPYNDEIRDHILSLNYARTALADIYFKAMSGASEGN